MTKDVSTLIAQRVALLDAWSAKQRQIAVLQSEAAGLLAQRWALMEDEIEAAPLHREVIIRSMIAEHSAAGHVSKGSMEFAFSDARMLAEEFDLTRAAFQAGRLSPGHVREIIRESDAVREAVRTGTVSPDTLALYEAAVLEVAEHDTPARTKTHARQVAAALAGLTIVEQHKKAAEERAVTIRSVGDGMALLQAVLPEHLAVGIMDRLTQMARHQTQHPEDRTPVLPPTTPEEAGWNDEEELFAEAQDDRLVDAIFAGDTFSIDPLSRQEWDDIEAEAAVIRDAHAVEADLTTDPRSNPDSPLIIHIPDDTRTMDQRRADLFADLLLASAPSTVHGTGLDNIHAIIQVTVAATTLTGADDLPAELDGHGPLHPDAARALAGARTGWTRLFLGPRGFVTETDTYTPTEPMRRYLRARDQHCRFPGCRRPIHYCEIDHNHDYALGGRTEIGNLSHFCLAHHTLKHPSIPDEHRWTARQLPDQTVTWTSPTGREYTDPARRRVMFVPSDEADTEPSAAEPPDTRPPGSSASNRSPSNSPTSSPPPDRRFTFDSTTAPAMAGAPF
ncbi:hypothetical protein QF046_000029 [Microbacterium sp. W4I4]|uniref:HNH endonuclease signature motif containing protein n=1 Tax=Microbacterium sp. W4I4 TaxID=3042295 RepID=UPI00278AA600|nr:HNH endonuclease signature motif containing protein [Microbacterium sp. W4I4]MDQ0612388.1 hypothetical protein [Microbacterium sp. W4I4]